MVAPVMGRGLFYDAWEHMSVSLAPGKVIVEDLAFTHWTNNHPRWFLKPGLVPDKVTVWWGT